MQIEGRQEQVNLVLGRYYEPVDGGCRDKQTTLQKLQWEGALPCYGIHEIASVSRRVTIVPDYAMMVRKGQPRKRFQLNDLVESEPPEDDVFLWGSRQARGGGNTLLA